MSLAMPAAMASAQTAASTTHVTGTVRSAGLPIPGATVMARQGDRRISTTTDENGQYELDLPSGTWNVEVNMMAFGTARRDVVVAMRRSAPTTLWKFERPRASSSQIAVREAGRRASAVDFAT